MIGRFFLTVLIAGLWLGAHPLTANSENFCWVQRVEKTASGVKVHLSTQFPVSIKRQGEPWRLVAPDSKASTNGAVDVVAAALGDQLRFNGSTHSSCMMDVVSKDRKIGIEVYGTIAAPGGGANRTGAQFIIAE